MANKAHDAMKYDGRYRHMCLGVCVCVCLWLLACVFVYRENRISISIIVKNNHINSNDNVQEWQRVQVRTKFEAIITSLRCYTCDMQWYNNRWTEKWAIMNTSYWLTSHNSDIKTTHGYVWRHVRWQSPNSLILDNILKQIHLHETKFGLEFSLCYHFDHFHLLFIVLMRLLEAYFIAICVSTVSHSLVFFYTSYCRFFFILFCIPFLFFRHLYCNSTKFFNSNRFNRIWMYTVCSWKKKDSSNVKWEDRTKCSPKNHVNGISQFPKDCQRVCRISIVHVNVKNSIYIKLFPHRLQRNILRKQCHVFIRLTIKWTEAKMFLERKTFRSQAIFYIIDYMR